MSIDKGKSEVAETLSPKKERWVLVFGGPTVETVCSVVELPCEALNVHQIIRFAMATVHGAEETMSSKKTKAAGLVKFPLWGWILRKTGVSYTSIINRPQHGDKKTS